MTIIETLRSTPTTLTDAVTGRTSRRQHTALAAAAFVALGATNTTLESSYAASGHPVGYAEGQLAFNGSTIKSHYAHMAELGTLDTYVTTQLIDFTFIAAVTAVGVFLATRIARANGSGRAATAAALAAVLLVAGAAFDATENLISFVMLADPAGFPNLLAVPYSTMAAAKFLCIGTAMVMLAAAIVVRLGRSIRALAGRDVAAVA